MDLELDGKRALVTGASSGIGAAIAERLAREGARVAVHGRDEARTGEVAGRIGGVPAVGDLASAEQADAVARRAIDALGGVDILVNNAGIFDPTAFEETDDASWARHFEVNVMSGVRLSRSLMAAMRDAGWGRIVFVSSESGLNIPGEMVHYGVSKASQIALAGGLAKVLAGTGVTVNSVLPGPTWTEGAAGFVNKIAEQQGKDGAAVRERFVTEHRPTSLTGRFSRPEEIADAVAYLVSPLAGSTTGSSLRVEGGIVNSPF